jgi:hypothetical protein
MQLDLFEIDRVIDDMQGDMRLHVPQHGLR